MTLISPKNQEHHYLIFSIGAGLKLDLHGKTVQVISPQSVIGNELIGAYLEDTIFIERGSKLEEWKVNAIG